MIPLTFHTLPRSSKHYRRFPKILPLYLSLLLFITSSIIYIPHAQALTLDTLIKKIQSVYGQAETLQADFAQETTFQGFSTSHRFEGKLYLKKPDKMRWDYQSPSKQQIFLEGESFTYYIPEHQQVIISRLSHKTSQEIPIHLLATLSTLEKDYDVQWEEEPHGASSPYRLHLIPKNTPGEATFVIVEINSKTYYIDQMKVVSPNGNQSVISFFNIQVNQRIPDDLFTFNIPEGVEIVRPPSRP